MLIDSPSPGSDPVLPGPALVQNLAFPPGGQQLENLLSSPLITCQELLTLHVRSAGEGQVFLVAQAGWGADAAPAAQAAYGKIARVLQDQGLTVVHERLFGSLTVKPAVLAARAAARGLSNLPAVIMVADVCREELLFEMDAEVAFDPSLRGF